MSRTCCNTLTACLTFFLIDYRNTVYNVDCIKRTCLDTRTVSHTAVCTCLWTAVWRKWHYRTFFYAGILVIFLCLFAVTRTFYKCCHSGRFTNLSTHNCRNLFGNRFTTDRTGTYRCFSCCDCLCKGITACVTAAAAVITRKFCSDINFFLVYFYCKLLTHYTEEKSQYQTCKAANYSRYNNTCHFLFLL